MPKEKNLSRETPQWQRWLERMARGKTVPAWVAREFLGVDGAPDAKAVAKATHAALHAWEDGPLEMDAQDLRRILTAGLIAAKAV